MLPVHAANKTDLVLSVGLRVFQKLQQELS